MKVPDYPHPPHTFFIDRWNPYDHRDFVGHMLDKETSDKLLHCNDWSTYVEGSYDCFFTGCLDAPEEIPLGGTECISTIGGFNREAYMRVHRHSMSLTQNERQEISDELATMLKKILDETDK